MFNRLSRELAAQVLGRTRARCKKHAAVSRECCGLLPHGPFRRSMTRRSITNERYTTEDPNKGTTRKSASQAKPAREVAGTVYMKDPNAKKTRKQLRQEEMEREAKRKKKEEKSASAADQTNLSANSKINAEIKQWRRIWWVSIAMGVLLVILSWFAKDINGMLFTVTIIGAYAMVGFALFIEFGRINKLRKKLTQPGVSNKMSSKQLKHRQEAEKLEEARRAAKKSKSKRISLKKKDQQSENYPMDESSEH